MGKRTGKAERYIVVFALALLFLTGLFGCGAKEAEERGIEEENASKILLSLEDGEIRSIWMEDDVLYAFVAWEDTEVPYGIYEVKDGGLLEETPYQDVIKKWIETELKKAAASGCEYEARLGRNKVVYLLGRDREGNVKRCYWIEKTFYTDVLFYEKHEERDITNIDITNIEISREGKLYLETRYGGFVIPYDNFNERIGLSVDTENKRTALGEKRMYQFVEGWIYVWDIPSGASMEMIRCDVLTNCAAPVFIDRDDNIYLVGGSGLAYLPFEGSIWEILLDKDDGGFYGGTLELKQIWVYEEELYLLGMNLETDEWQILKQNLPKEAVRK